MNSYINQAYSEKPNLSLLDMKICYLADIAEYIKDKNIPGDVVECGVYKGGCARLLATIFSDKNILLFDSFSGMIEDDSHPNGHHKKGEFSDTTLESVQEYLDDKPNCCFHPGWFPHSSNFLTNETFSFVHIDFDLYQSTKSAVELFWPRLNTKGIILFDDYDWEPCPGVNTTILEYFTDQVAHAKYFGPNMCAIQKL